MKLKDIANMEYYLKNDCYCPGEIYDMTGFFYQVFNKDDDCIKLGERKSIKNDETIVCVVCKTQIINFWVNNKNCIVGAERYDATENNVKVMKLWINNQDVDGMKLDDFKEGETIQSFDYILKYADVIMLN